MPFFKDIYTKWNWVKFVLHISFSELITETLALTLTYFLCKYILKKMASSSNKCVGVNVLSLLFFFAKPTAKVTDDVPCFLLEILYLFFYVDLLSWSSIGAVNANWRSVRGYANKLINIQHWQIVFFLEVTRWSSSKNYWWCSKKIKMNKWKHRLFEK